MTYPLKTSLAAALCLLVSWQCLAQGLHLPSNALPALSATAPTQQSQADFIVAIVNSEPITNYEVRSQMQRVLQQLARQHRAPPPEQALARQVLEDLINQKAQLQQARDTGLRVEESAIDQAEQSIALQNQIDLPELHRRIEKEGQTVSQFRAQLADEVLLQRLRERDVDSRVKVSEQDVDQYLHDQQALSTTLDAEINLAQVLVAVPENATPAQVQTLKERAQMVLQKARQGDNFAALVHQYSDASDLGTDGQLGLRPASRYPELFVKATQQIPVGEVAELVRSPAGFHVLKVIDKVRPGLAAMTVTQSHARHILLIPGPNLTEAQARQKLLDFRAQVLSKQADFATLAREYSKDGSAAQGGDLGWANPGMFVPEFEATMNRLAPGEISEPLLSRFGLHLIQLLERRQVALTPQQQRDEARALLRQKKIEETYRTWAQGIRGRAYVEMREPPL